MVTSAQCFTKYGDPATYETKLVVWHVPVELQVGKIPKKVYCNKDLINPLTQAFTNLIQRKHVTELKTWDGCWNIRKKRGGNSMSLHSWAIAIDVNAAENGLGKPPNLSPGFVKCFTDAGFEWGGFWKNPIDGMHFQLKSLP